MFSNKSATIQLLYQGDYSIYFGLVSLLLCALTAYIAIDTLRRVNYASQQKSWVWLTLSAINMGIGFWASNYIGILSFIRPETKTYDKTLTLLSVFPAFLVAIVIINMIHQRHLARKKLLAASVLFAIGMTFIHYLEILSLHFPGHITLHAYWLIFSVAATSALSYLLMRFIIVSKLVGQYYELVAALVLSVIVFAMHFILTTSTYYTKDFKVKIIEERINSNDLISLVSAAVGISLLLLVFSYIVAYTKFKNSQQHSERDLALLLDTIEDYAIIELDQYGYIRSWNKSAERIHGYFAEEVLGKSFSIFYPKAETLYGRCADILKQALSNNQFEEEGYRYRKDGSQFWANVVVRPILSTNGKLKGYSKVTRNFTRRKTAEETINQKQQFITRITDAMSEAVYVVDQKGFLIFINPEAERLLGWKWEEIQECNMHSIVHPPKEDGTHLKYEDSLVRQSMLRNEVLHSETRQFTSKAGIQFAVALSASPLRNGDDITGSVVIFRNIENEKIIAETLKQSASRMRELLELSPIAVRISSIKTGKIVFANQSFASLVRIKADKVIGTKPNKFHQNPQDYAEIVKMASSGRPVVNRLLKLQTLDTEQIWCLASYYCIEYEGERAVLGWLYDVSDLKQAQEAAEDAVRTKSQFLSTMSHEIRTPMNGVVGMVDLILDSHLDDQQRDFAKTIKDSANALLDVINDILDFSKIEAGKLEIVPKQFNLMKLVESCVDLLATNASQKNITLMSYTDPKTPSIVIGDEGRIRQVIINLLGNAIKFTNHGEVSLMTSVIKRDEHECNIRVEIKDTGIGMSQNVINTLFQPFIQGDGSITRLYGGTGLGLTISKRLIEAMGGEIGIDSAVNKGSTFWFEINLNIEENLSDELGLNFIAGRTALVLATEGAARSVIVKSLATWGIHGKEVANTNDLLETLAIEEPFDLVVLTTLLPNLELEKTLLEVRKIHLGQRILVLSDNRKLISNFDERTTYGPLHPIKQSVLFDSILVSLDRRQILDHRRTTKHQNDEADMQKTGSAKDFFILLVDDNIINQKVAENQLSRLNYKFTIVSNGAEAITTLNAAHFDLILMDCHMPVMDGYEATKIIREQEKTTGQHIPIIAMTANAMTGDREVCLAVGMDDYLAKPIKSSELEAILETHLKKDVNKINKELTPPQIGRKVVDINRLVEVFGDDKAVISNILNIFAQSMVDTMRKLNIAFEDKNYIEIKLIGHQITGSSSNIGLEILSDLGRNLEHFALNAIDLKVQKLLPNEAQAHDLLSSLQDALTEVVMFGAQFDKNEAIPI